MNLKIELLKFNILTLNRASEFKICWITKQGFCLKNAYDLSQKNLIFENVSLKVLLYISKISVNLKCASNSKAYENTNWMLLNIVCFGYFNKIQSVQRMKKVGKQ